MTVYGFLVCSMCFLAAYMALITAQEAKRLGRWIASEVLDLLATSFIAFILLAFLREAICVFIVLGVVVFAKYLCDKG